MSRFVASQVPDIDVFDLRNLGGGARCLGEGGGGYNPVGSTFIDWTK